MIGVCLATTAHAYASSKELQCKDISSLDFKNLTFQVGKMSFEFHNGEASNYNTPDYVPINPEDGPPDWDAEIDRDSIVNASAIVPVRFLLIDNMHVAGSGWDYYLVGFRCSNGVLKTVFALNGHLSLKIEQLDPSGVVMSTIPWGKTKRAYSTYVWNDKAEKYIRSAASIRN
jgi:hypothetical protein